MCVPRARFVSPVLASTLVTLPVSKPLHAVPRPERVAGLGAGLAFLFAPYHGSDTTWAPMQARPHHGASQRAGPWSAPTPLAAPPAPGTAADVHTPDVRVRRRSKVHKHTAVTSEILFPIHLLKYW